MTPEEFIVMVVLATLSFAVIGAYIVERKRDVRVYPYTKGWKWAYICSLWPMSMTTLFLFLSMIIGPDILFREPGVLAGFLSMLVLTIPGIFVINRRSRMAFVVLTVFTFMPVLWIINGVYIALRWKEQSVYDANVVYHSPPAGNVIDAEYEEVKSR